MAPDGVVFTMNAFTGQLTLKFTITGVHLPGSVAADPIGACRFTRSLTLAYSNATRAFRGMLDSSSAPCRKQKQVFLFRVTSSGDLQVGADKTDAAGHFVVPAAKHPGKYYVTAARTSGTLGTCLAATSPTVVIKP